MQYEIKKLSEVENFDREQLSKLFVESFQNKMGAVSKDLKQLEEIFQHTFDPAYYYVCLDKKKIVGMAACSDAQGRGIFFNKETKQAFVRRFGMIRGRIALLLASVMLTQPAVKEANEGYIETVATAPEYRGRGIATALIHHIHQATDYERYVLDVIQGNDGAKNIYEKLGYTVFKVETGIVYRLMKVEALYLMEFFKEELLEDVG
ncbi:MAG: GNAT family N-acetyltransferase [Cellulosilyticaceae bacterium]